MPHPTAVAVSAADLTKTYAAGRGRPPVRALDGLSLDIPRGSVFALLGRNGAGKSTTVRILATLARPDSGRATVAGHDVGHDPEAVRHAIGLISQKASSDPLATARENLLLAGRIQAMTGASARARADELLERFGLADAADRRAGTFSGGMSRRLDVAIGLMHRPDVLFLDEPTTGLDPEARTDMWAEIRRMTADDEVTVLLTTHYLEEADRLADRVAIVDAGRVVVEGAPETLKREMRGDTVQVQLATGDAAPGVLRLLERVDGLHGVAAEGALVRARATAGARAVPSVVGALEDAGFGVESVTVARPSLDDVYLHYAGRSLEAAA